MIIHDTHPKATHNMLKKMIENCNENADKSAGFTSEYWQRVAIALEDAHEEIMRLQKVYIYRD